MTLCVNDSGTWREISTLCVNDSGTWRQVTTGCINDSGTWREFGMGPDIAGASLGDNIEGGYLICKSGGIAWIVAPSSTQVSRSWYARADAVTTANAEAACGDWFIPNCTQLNNPGRICCSYWDTACVHYWSDSERDSYTAWAQNFQTGNPFFSGKQHAARFYGPHYVRAFRCVSY